MSPGAEEGRRGSPTPHRQAATGFGLRVMPPGCVIMSEIDADAGVAARSGPVAISRNAMSVIFPAFEIWVRILTHFSNHAVTFQCVAMKPHNNGVIGAQADFSFTLGQQRAQKWGLREL